MENEELEQEEIKEQDEIKKEENKEVEEQEISEETKLKDTILLQKEQLDEQEDRLKRLMAEFDNFKKEVQKKEKHYIIH